MRAAGAWVFTGGLHPPEHGHRAAGRRTATCSSPTARSPRARSTSAGSAIIRAPDLDAALDWGRKATAACTLPIEVRPMVDMAEG